MTDLARRWAKRWLGPELRFGLRSQQTLLRTHGFAWTWRWNRMLLDAWVRDRFNRRHYREIGEAEARARRKSDVVFVFGSGYSLHDLSAEEWAHVAEHDVFGFNQFFYERWVPASFHLLKAGFYEELRWKPYAQDVADILRAHPCFAHTVFVMQEGYSAQFSNQLVGYRLLPASATLLRFRTVRGDGPPTRSLADGLRHHGGTLVDAVNCAFCLGWTSIVLVGVDLYDSRYFYLPPDQTVTFNEATQTIGAGEFNPTRGQRFDEPHNTVRIGIVDIMAEWHRALAAAGVSLSVYNPRSLLAGVLPVYSRPDAVRAAAP